MIQGLIGVGIGVLIYEAPGVPALLLVLYIAVRSLANGVLDIVASASLRNEIKEELWLAAAGIISILFAIALIAAPVVSLLAVVWIISTYAVIFGLIMVMLGFRLRRLRCCLGRWPYNWITAKECSTGAARQREIADSPVG